MVKHVCEETTNESSNIYYRQVTTKRPTVGKDLNYKALKLLCNSLERSDKDLTRDLKEKIK